MSVVDKFLKYVSFDTQSDAYSSSSPSTKKQLKLAEELKNELAEMGVSQAEVDPYGIVYAYIPANTEDPHYPAIGLISHMDTASEMSGKNVRPRIVHNYDGGPIRLNDQYSMDSEDFPSLKRCIGSDLIVTDGTTLLGGDDKAGIAIIMAAVERVLQTNQPHGKIFIAFTPDEEIGRGVENFDLDKFPADFAYTLDGGDIREVDYETFNAAMAIVDFKGKTIHPGDAKGRMINAAMAAVTYANMLPQWERPEFTEGSEGFFHLLEMSGECESASLHYLIRDHDRQKFEQKKQILRSVQNYINELYPDCCKLEINDQYYNLKDYMDGDMTSVELAKRALEENGITPVSNPVRGGTDGAMLTARGLITPNLGTGDGNCHGRYEFVSIQELTKMVDVVCRILEG